MDHMHKYNVIKQFIMMEKEKILRAKDVTSYRGNGIFSLLLWESFVQFNGEFVITYGEEPFCYCWLLHNYKFLQGTLIMGLQLRQEPDYEESYTFLMSFDFFANLIMFLMESNTIIRSVLLLLRYVYINQKCIHVKSHVKCSKMLKLLSVICIITVRFFVLFCFFWFWVSVLWSWIDCLHYHFALYG